LERAAALNTPCVLDIAPTIDLMPREFLDARGVTAIHGRAAKAKAIGAYSRLIVNEVSDLVPAVLFQSACFERYGWPGVQVLEEAVDYARERGLLVLLDASRGGTGKASIDHAAGHLDAKAEAAPADAMTVSPYLGHEALEPFLKASESTGRGIFVNLKSSSAEAALFQDILSGEGRPMWTLVADYLFSHSVGHRGKLGFSSIGAVFSALQPELAIEARELLPEHLFLVRGVGPQGSRAEGLFPFFNTQGLGALIATSPAVHYPQRFEAIGKHGDGSIRGATLDFIDAVRQVVPKIVA
jgi:orotidine-5'-phosphate decarboxylase